MVSMDTQLLMHDPRLPSLVGARSYALVHIQSECAQDRINFNRLFGVSASMIVVFDANLCRGTVTENL